MILFPKEKIGVIFFIRKKTIPGGGGGVRGGGWQKTIKNTGFFSALTALTSSRCTIEDARAELLKFEERGNYSNFLTQYEF